MMTSSGDQLEPAERKLIDTIRRIRASGKRGHTVITIEINRHDLRMTEHAPRGVLRFLGTKPLPPLDMPGGEK